MAFWSAIHMRTQRNIRAFLKMESTSKSPAYKEDNVLRSIPKHIKHVLFWVPSKFRTKLRYHNFRIFTSQNHHKSSHYLWIYQRKNPAHRDSQEAAAQASRSATSIWNLISFAKVTVSCCERPASAREDPRQGRVGLFFWKRIRAEGRKCQFYGEWIALKFWVVHPIYRQPPKSVPELMMFVPARDVQVPKR